MAKGPRVAKSIIGLPLELATGVYERIGRVATSAHNDDKCSLYHRGDPKRRAVVSRNNVPNGVVQIGSRQETKLEPSNCGPPTYSQRETSRYLQGLLTYKVLIGPEY
jgi:hypothetical protein